MSAQVRTGSRQLRLANRNARRDRRDQGRARSSRRKVAMSTPGEPNRIAPIEVFDPCILATLCYGRRFQSTGAGILARVKSVSLGAR